jgi:hypothetical protein
MKTLSKQECRVVAGSAGLYVPNPPKVVTLGGGYTPRPGTAALNVPGPKWPGTTNTPLRGYRW